MLSLQEVIRTLKAHKSHFERKYNITSIKIFGSYAKGTQKPTSDLDLIVSFSKTPTLLDLVRLEEELESILGVKVDILTEDSISPFIKPYIKETVAV
ncbi:nucleotidyltransferase [Thermosulfidibacter takaii ABI70S6]|uniref:Nucleotidyltransferase n=1 Tax=Thermosulfidibacter takaii (strain DSM 17441 / JCM 13301 / NBRC 103674 / ABI70S6) TaxID=1298851 RepID=A0A0S3QUF9_THET7|nr:nucleotidyltransferase family protein [Thermosulfidibacter takaii]BAT71955.1 nucleotidyltransferase [Thermosulfidibacter takaii ABI70S6]